MVLNHGMSFPIYLIHVYAGTSMFCVDFSADMFVFGVRGTGMCYTYGMFARLMVPGKWDRHAEREVAR